jgi:DNA-binding GntR family transcriptional regulator
MMNPYLRIKDEIISCNLRPGDIVNEHDTAARYNVGRGAVREALQALVRDGFVEAIPRVGYIVSPLAVKDVVDLYGVRTIVETAAVGLAAANASPEEIDVLRGLIAIEGLRQDELTLKTLNRRNTEFHCAIGELTHNKVLAAIQSWVMERLERLFNLGLPAEVPVVLAASTRQHQALVDAIAAGDSEKAREIALHELELSRQRSMEAILMGDVAGSVTVSGSLERGASGLGNVRGPRPAARR